MITVHSTVQRYPHTTSKIYRSWCSSSSSLYERFGNSMIMRVQPVQFRCTRDLSDIFSLMNSKSRLSCSKQLLRLLQGLSQCTEEAFVTLLGKHRWEFHSQSWSDNSSLWEGLWRWLCGVDGPCHPERREDRSRNHEMLCCCCRLWLDTSRWSFRRGICLRLHKSNILGLNLSVMWYVT